MKFNDVSDTQNSLYHYTLFLLGFSSTDITSFPLQDFSRSANSWLRKAVFMEWNNSAFWQFDDANYTTLPIATTTLVDSQQDYTMPSNVLDIERIEVLGADGRYYPVKQIDKSMVKDRALTEFYNTPGLPKFYDLFGQTIYLYPAPAAGSVTLSSGLKVYLSRDIDGFVYTDTTKEPGINIMFHPYLAYGSAMDFAMAKNLDPNKVATIKLGVDNYEATISTYYGRRDKDIKTKVRPAVRSSV